MPSPPSSTNSNQSDQPDPAHLGSVSRIYKLQKTCFQRHYEVLGPSEQVDFHAEIVLLSLHKPDIILHAGGSKDGAVVAACKFLKLSGAYKVCLGDPNDPVNNQWEDMTKETIRGSQYRFELSLGEGRRAFLWKRTRNVAVDGLSISALGSRNYKLVDEATGELLAVFTSQRTYRNCGTLQISADLGQKFDMMVMVSCISLYEKARRRNRRSAAGGGGGGGS
ncbi:hypothetical protein PVAR5_5205 [Paecilomyces variotii No. 5]|uniref:Tubby C-terminal-like domain-containing protein n=1 Tax=Byssochlamys spectabilis (strain No. 5 / NBRC 109023) TaxID=1356009 RepID=V5G6R1_BYSSN|nr:hypothetical protein PVAR5_5205 [Paecilomyces variotii No. 5]